METETFDLSFTETEILDVLLTVPSMQWQEASYGLWVQRPAARRDPSQPRHVVVSFDAAVHDGGPWDTWKPIADAMRFDLAPTAHGTRILARSMFDSGYGQIHFQAVLAALRRLTPAGPGADAVKADTPAVKKKGRRRREMPFSAFETKLNAACAALWNGGRGLTPTKSAVCDTNPSLRESTIDEYLDDENLNWSDWLDAWLERQTG